MVSNACIYLLVAEIIVLLTGPLLGFAILRIKKQATFTSFFSGIGTYLVFALILDSLANYFFTGYLSGFGELVSSNIVFYTLYFGIMAALFEVGAMYFVMKFVMKQSILKVDALSFGFGFGGLQMLINFGFGAFVNMSYASLLNNLGIEEFIEQLCAPDGIYAVSLEEANAVVSGLTSMDVGIVALDLSEACIFIAMQIFLAILVYYAVNYHDIQSLGIAAAIRFVFVVPAVLVSYNVLSAGITAILIEAMIAAGAGYVAIRRYKNMKQKIL